MKSKSFASMLSIMFCLLFTQSSLLLFDLSSFHELLVYDKLSALTMHAHAELIMAYGIAFLMTYGDQCAALLTSAKKPSCFELDELINDGTSKYTGLLYLSLKNQTHNETTYHLQALVKSSEQYHTSRSSLFIVKKEGRNVSYHTVGYRYGSSL